MKHIDISGKRFGRLVVVSLKTLVRGVSWWNCKCDCGSELVVRRNCLRPTLGTRSCGCFKIDSIRRVGKVLNKKHGHTAGGKVSREWKAWECCRSRCYYKKDINYENYGGRGIKVCQRWLESFENFLADMGAKPTPDHMLDRINNDGDYCPENCRWATRIEQANNKRTSRFIIVDGVSKTLAQWSRDSGISTDAIAYRVDHGWSPSRAVSERARVW